VVTRWLFLSVLILGGSIFSAAQEEENVAKPFEQRGLMHSQGTFSPEWMTAERQINHYFHGIFGLYFNEKVSFFSDTYLFTGDQEKFREGPTLKKNHSTFSGLAFHFTEKKRFDPFVSLQPGAAWVQLKADDLERASPSVIEPLIGVGGGANYYVGKYFNFFLMVKYIHGMHVVPHHSPFRLNSFRFSGGLGWNLRIFNTE
jgi:hypothetical protein